MRNEPDEVLLSSGVERWPVELAEALLANAQPWGPPVYIWVVGYVNDVANRLPHQHDLFLALARNVNGVYKRHGSMSEAVNWASPIVEQVQTGGSCAAFSTQDLLDIVFLYGRGERFTEGLIRGAEPVLRTLILEVVKRVHSQSPPIFLPGGGR